MDQAPLTAAQSHARKAAVLTQNTNANGAQEEHELAAQEFSRTRRGIDDLEAVRILDLLQQHHEHLAKLIRSASINPAPCANPSLKDGNVATGSTATVKSSAQDPHASRLASRTSTSPVRTRRLHREVSSSIADNLARQRRGLPATPEVSTQQAGGRISNHVDRQGYFNTSQISGKKTRTLPMTIEDRMIPASPDGGASHQSSDASFSRFYNTFEALFSKLSGPLAFAGLPLTAEQAARDAFQQQSKKSEKEKSTEKTRATSSDEPDLTKIYSSAALKAIREDVGPSFGPQESFYLVPPTGGNVSYAGMVSGGRGSAIIHDVVEDDGEEFVDARENLGPPSPRSLRNSRKGGSLTISRENSRKGGVTVGGGGKTQEELELEITVLKQLLDAQAKRLQVWEMSSQSQSIALQQNMRAVRQRPDLPNISSDQASLERLVSSSTTAADTERIRQLEAMLKAEQAERTAMEAIALKTESENKRLQITVGRYREKWEQLKEGARRREERKARTVADGTGTPKTSTKAGESTDG